MKQVRNIEAKGLDVIRTDVQDPVWKTNTLSLTKNFCCQTSKVLLRMKRMWLISHKIITARK